MRMEVRAIDAWANSEGGWTWNDSWVIGHIEVEFDPDDRRQKGKVWKAIRRSGLFNIHSGGKLGGNSIRIRLEDVPVGDDTYMVDMVCSKSRQPLWSFREVASEEDDEKPDKPEDFAYFGNHVAFSWSPCELCGSALGGERFVVERRDHITIDVCSDCLDVVIEKGWG